MALPVVRSLPLMGAHPTCLRGDSCGAEVDPELVAASDPPPAVTDAGELPSGAEDEDSGMAPDDPSVGASELTAVAAPAPVV